MNDEKNRVRLFSDWIKDNSGVRVLPALRENVLWALKRYYKNHPLYGYYLDEINISQENKKILNTRFIKDDFKNILLNEDVALRRMEELLEEFKNIDLSPIAAQTIRLGKTKILDLMLKNGFDINKEYIVGKETQKLPIETAFSKGGKDMINKIMGLKEFDINVKNAAGNNIAWMAIYYNKPIILKKILKDKNLHHLMFEKNKNLDTPIDYIVKNSPYGIFEKVSDKPKMKPLFSSSIKAEFHNFFKENFLNLGKYNNHEIDKIIVEVSADYLEEKLNKKENQKSITIKV